MLSVATYSKVFVFARFSCQLMLSMIFVAVNITDGSRKGSVRLDKCKLCGFDIKSRSEFRKHLMKTHNVKPKPWKCPLCDYRGLKIKKTLLFDYNYCSGLILFILFSINKIDHCEAPQYPSDGESI